MPMTKEQYQAVAARAERLVGADEVEQALERLAVAITDAMADTNPVVLCVMTGAVIFAGRLLPKLDFPLEVDYVHASRYQGATSGGAIAWRHRPSDKVRGRNVLVLDDIYDEGITLDVIVKACNEDGAASVHSGVLVEKLRDRECVYRPDFVGIELPNRYLYGCGLDYKEYFRNADGIYAVADEDV